MFILPILSLFKFFIQIRNNAILLTSNIIINIYVYRIYAEWYIHGSLLLTISLFSNKCIQVSKFNLVLSIYMKYIYLMCFFSCFRFESLICVGFVFFPKMWLGSCKKIVLGSDVLRCVINHLTFRKNVLAKTKRKHANMDFDLSTRTIKSYELIYGI